MDNRVALKQVGAFMLPVSSSSSSSRQDNMEFSRHGFLGSEMALLGDGPNS